ncbi:MAG: hypothetical protein KatS3mg061_1983 [Dehalococcoidia bacterium]|nr:MAG: hypothetical protein KatS3mg061_1983 [Dehalococcoidia bacterium]
MRVAIIGGGKMGEAILGRILSAGGELAASAVVEVDPARQHYLRARYSLPVVITPAEALAQADLVLLAVKPQDAPLLYPQLRGRLGAQQVLVSILAGGTDRGAAGGARATPRSCGRCRTRPR